MKIKNLKANFRGTRNYLHSTTVLNHIYNDNTRFKEVKFHKMTKYQIEFSNERKNSFYGEIYFDNDEKNKSIVYMNETNDLIKKIEEYSEQEIINMTYKKKDKLFFNASTKKFTFFDVTIAMIKYLNYLRYPSAKKKWVAGSYKLNNKIDIFPKSEIVVEINKTILDNFSNNIIYYRSSKVAESNFFLI